MLNKTNVVFGEMMKGVVLIESINLEQFLFIKCDKFDEGNR